MATTTAGLSPVLYHVTGTDKLVDILRQDRFVLAFASGANNPGKPNEHFYYMSAMRVPSGGYRGKGDVVLVLDGQKLGQRYKGSPMDYWGPEWRKTADKNQIDRAPYDEAEDRVWAREPIIPKAHQYIQEIHFVVPIHERYHEDATFRTRHNQDARKIILAGKRFGIPVYVYRDSADLKLLNKAKAVPLKDLDLRDEVIPEKEQWMLERRTHNPGYSEKQIDLLIELYHAQPDRDKLSPGASRELYHTQGRDFPHVLPETIKRSLPEWRKKLTDIWRKIGVQDAVGYGKWLNDKFFSESKEVAGLQATAKNGKMEAVWKTSVNLCLPNPQQNRTVLLRNPLKGQRCGLASSLPGGKKSTATSSLKLNSVSEILIPPQLRSSTPEDLLQQLQNPRSYRTLKGPNQYGTSGDSREWLFSILIHGDRNEYIVYAVDFYTLPYYTRFELREIRIPRQIQSAISNPQFSTQPRKWDGRNAIDQLMSFGPEAAYVVEEGPVEWVRNHVKIPESDLYYEFHPKTDPVTGETTEPPVLTELPDSFFEMYRTAVWVEGVDFRSYQKSDDLQETIMRVLLSHRDRPPQITLRTVNPKQEKRIAVQQLLRHGISGQTVLADVPILLEPAADPAVMEPEQPINPIQLQLIRAPGPGESVEPLAQDRMDLIRSQYHKQALRADTFEDFQELLSHILVEQQLVEQYRRTVAGVLNGIRVPLGYVAL